MYFNVDRIDDFLPLNLLFVRLTLFCVSFVLLLVCLEIDRARTLPSLFELALLLNLLELALFLHLNALALLLHLLVLALLLIILVRVPPAADFLQLFINSLVVLFVYLARFPIQRAEFDRSIGGGTGHIDAPICFFITTQAHA